MFFFSSRRRHTRYIGDWSSDVCSSDLAAEDATERDICLQDEIACLADAPREGSERVARFTHEHGRIERPDRALVADALEVRSEERRVGKDGRCRWGSW